MISLRPSRISLFIIFWIITVVLYARTDPNDSTRAVISPNDLPKDIKGEVYRTFEGLNLDKLTAIESDPIVVPKEVLPDSIQEKRDHAHALLEKVMQGQRFLESLDALAEIELPVGIIKSGGAATYSILIDRINFTPQGAIMEVYVSLELPQSSDRIAFNGKIPLSAEGGISGTARVNLVGDHHIQLGNASLLTIKGTQNTYVEFDCNGFKGISIEGIVQFSRELIVPEDENGQVIQNDERVKINFLTYAQSLNDLLIGVNIPPFQVQGLEGFGFQVQQAFMDWSDLANPPGLLFPQNYQSPFLETGTQNLWRGFFLQRLDVRLPPSFANRSDERRVTIGVENMILDDQGFTGELFAENVIEAGNMSGWAYTLDRLEVRLVTNQVTGFQLAGMLSVPALKGNEGEASQFGYIAQRGANGNYIFTVSMHETVKLSAWTANLTVYPGSSVTVSEKNNRFYPSANLNGHLAIRISNKGPKASLNGIRFEGMRISTEAPHFSVQSVSYGSDGEKSDVSKFPVVIRNISVKSEDDRSGLGFDLTINIGGGAADEGFGGTASLIIWGAREMQEIKDAEGVVVGHTEQGWKFDKLELSGVAINISKPNAYELKGSILFFDADPVFGDGFKGTVEGKISKFGGIKGTALFGKTETFRYWYADALVTLPSPGVPLMPGVLFANAFGGGFYSRMKQTTQRPATAIGETASGIYYVPDENTMGVRAIMKVGTARPEAMNGDVSLEVVMNRHGGINSITFTGNANFMSLADLGPAKIRELATSAVAGKLTEKLAGLIKGQVFGSMRLHFDNVNDVFHGNLEVYVNVAGGLVRGVSEGNKAGWAVLHFEKSDWYVLIGTPDQPIGLEVARIFKASSYFMLGKNLPGSPPPPSQVTEILGPDIDLDYMRDMNALESGMGFAFGLHFIVDTGDLRFLMFYGRFAAGTGVDFMLKDYGTGYHCAGDSGPFGINGWYANGQAYAFVMGKIGIRVNLRFYKGNYDILDIGAAAVLQTKGPNPFWMRGIVGGYYKILGGLVKGRCRFEVTVGKECVPVGEQNLLADVQMISEISPSNGSSDVDVFNAPQVAFNIPVGEVFEIRDLEDKKHRFRAVLDRFVVTDGSTPIEGILEWSSDQDVVVFDAHDLLPGKKKLKASARLVFEEYKSGWEQVKFQGKVVDETKETDFQTGEAPDHIPANNVLFSYPVAGQVNFHPHEYNQGFIQLDNGQPYLFNPGREWIQKVRMINAATRSYIETDFSYDRSRKRISFAIPSGFANASVYNFEILNIPRQRTVIDANVKKIESELIIGVENAGTATLTTKSIEGDLDRLEVESIYRSSFRTSKYNTFTEKFRSIQFAQSLRAFVDVNVFRLVSYIKGDELFDAADIGENSGSVKLIQPEAILSGNPWYETYVHPLVYDGYPLNGRFHLTRRNPDVLGIPPVRDLQFGNFNQLLALTDTTTPFSITPFSYEYLLYNVNTTVHLDYRDLQLQAVNYVADHPERLTSRLTRLIVSPTPKIRQGGYRVKLNYVIPGINYTSSTNEIEMFNSISDNDN